MDILRPAIEKAGAEINRIYHSDFSVQSKGKEGPVTEADLLANRIIVEAIESHYPQDGILSEEVKDNKRRLSCEYVWILDPIDGTREFIAKNGEFALSLGLTKNGQPIAGVIFNPARNLWVEKTESGDYPKPGIKNQKPKLAVSRTEAKEGLFEDAFWSQSFEFVMMGSIAYKLGLLSIGEFDIVISFKPKSEWDICGGLALLDPKRFYFRSLIENQPYSFNKVDTRSYGLLAGEKSVVDELLQMLPKQELASKVKYEW